jgi:hypothetical protein
VTIALDRDAIFVTLVGSRAHGTARPGADVDLRGVFVAPLADRVSLFASVEQVEGALTGALGDAVAAALAAHPSARHGVPPKTESLVTEVAKFLGLCATANPNALEILFADEGDWLYATPAWRTIHAARDRFLTRKVQQTYLGYGLAQLRKIQTHRAWLLAPPTHQPTRGEFGLPDHGTMHRDDAHRIEASIAERVHSYGIDDLELPKATRLAVTERLRAFWLDTLAVPAAALDDGLRAVAIGALQLPAAVVDALRAERRYRAAMRHWDAYEAWRTERNPARAALERQFGYDTKHAAHLVRLMRTGLEVLTDGALRVRRADADELRAIRDGALGYDQLIEAATALEAAMKVAAATTTLPADVDRAFVDGLLLAVITGT